MPQKSLRHIHPIHEVLHDLLQGQGGGGRRGGGGGGELEGVPGHLLLLLVLTEPPAAPRLQPALLLSALNTAR